MTRFTLLLILAVCAQVHAQSGRLMVAEAPEPAKVEGYEKGHCVALRNRVRVCKVLSDDAFLSSRRKVKPSAPGPCRGKK